MTKKFKRFMAIVLSISLFTTSTLYASNEDTTATFEEPDVQIELPLDDSDVTVQDDTQLPSDVEEEVQPDENQEGEQITEDEQITEGEESESDLESSDEEYAEEYSVVFHKPSVEGGFVTAWSEGEASAAVIYGADDTYTVDVTNGATLNFAIVANENFAIEEVTTQDGTIIEVDFFAEDAAIYKMEVTADTEITTVFTDLLAEEELEEVLKEQVENAQYTVSVVHILNTAIGKFRQGNELQLSNADFEVDSYDVLQHAVEKQGIALTTGTATLTTESFDENGNATVVVEYEIAQGWRAVSNYNVQTRSLYQGTFDDVTIVPVGQFPVTIAFNYENGIVAAPTVTIMADENEETQEFSFDYSITEKEGYDIQISDAAGFELSGTQLSGTFSNTMTSAFVNVTYVAKDATYKIVTRQQTVADLNEFEVIGEVTVNGKVGEVTEATSTEIAGFVAQPITQKEIAADNSTVVYVDYVRNTYRITFDTAGGSYKSPVVGVYQQAVTVYTDADTPTKAGAKFEGWYLDDQFKTKAPTTTVLSGDITVYAKWTAGTASYRIAYFREVWSAEGNYYVYTGDYETKTGTVGTTVTGSDSKSTSYSYLSGKLYNAAYRYHKYAGSDTAVVKADGSTVVAVYYDLKQYTITFYAKTSGLVPQNTNAVININGTSAKSYDMTAVVGQDISNIYPDASKITGYSGDKPYAWNSDDDKSPWVSKRPILTTDMVTTTWDSNFAKTAFTCYALYASTKTITVNYWLENPSEPGTYVKDASLSQTLQSSGSTFNAKDIFGHTYLNSTPAGYEKSTGNTYHFYYKVNKGSISFFDGATELKTVKNIGYGADISGQNYTPAQPTGERSDYVFAGWYDNASLLGVTPYNFKTMPDGVLQLFAKWVAPEKEVTLIYNYDNKEEIIKVEKGSPLTMADPERDGYVFGGWYTDESLQTAFDAAAPITKEVTLYARWIEAKATTYTVRYVVADATTESGYRDIKDSKIVSAISGTVVTEKALKIAGYEDYIVNRAVQTLELTTSAANNVITFVYSQQSEIEYKVQYTYNGAVISSTDWIKSAANVFNVYPEQEEVTKLMKLGYELKQSFVICNFGTDRENNIATFELGLWNFGITYTGLEGVTAWLGSTGAANPNPATYTVEDTFSLFNPSKPNHTFTGWKLVEGTNPDGTHSSMNTTISAGTTGNLKFEATWAEDTVTISYEVDQNNTQAGTVSRTSDTVKATTGDLTGTLSVASANDGYEFTGWYLGNSDTLVSADAALTAEKVNEYAKQNDAYTSTTFVAKFAVDTEVTMTYNVSMQEAGALSQTQETFYAKTEIPEGSSVTTVTKGYKFDNWTTVVDGQKVVVSTSMELTATEMDMYAKNDNGVYVDTTFTANFSKDASQMATIRYDQNIADAGTLTSQQESVWVAAEAVEGSEVSNVAAGYDFTQWVLVEANGTETVVTTSKELTQTIIDQFAKDAEGYYTNTTFKAYFAQKEDVELTYVAEGNGTVGISSEMVSPVTGNPTGTIATANAGYNFVGWFVGQTMVTSDATLSKADIDANAKVDNVYVATTFTAKFTEAENITITYTTNNSNAGTVSRGSESIAPVTGTPEGSTATAKAGYNFLGWYKGEQQVATSEVLTAEVVAEQAKQDGIFVSTTFEARFEEKVVTINYGAEQGGSVTVSSETLAASTDIANGSTAVVAAGYTFDGWYQGINKISTELVLTTSAVDAYAKKDGAYFETAFVARFKENAAVTISYVAEEGGSVSPASEALKPATGIANGSIATVKAGYTFDGWYLNNEKVADELVLTAENVEAMAKNAEGIFVATIFVAKFTEKANVTISYVAEEGGSVAPESESVAPATGSANGSTATAKAGYTFDGWYAHDTLVTNNEVLTSADVNGVAQVAGEYVATTFTAKFTEKANVTISYKAETGGSVSPASESVAPATGSAKGSTATVASNYVFVGWFAGETKVTENLTLATADVDKIAKATGEYVETTFTAKFAAKADVSITYVAEDGGSVSNAQETIKPTTGIPVGSSATAKAGYTFIGWFLNETQVSEEMQLTEAVIAEYAKVNGDYVNTEFTAKFTENAAVTISYVAEKGGSVSLATETLAPATGSAEGSSATAKAGYTFLGWFVGEVNVTENTVLTAAQVDTFAKATGEYVATTFTAKFAENANVTLSYNAQEGGSVSLATESLAPATGSAEGSTATAKAGYTFLGWFVNDELVTANETLATADVDAVAKTTGEYVATTFTAKFAEGENVTISYVAEDGGSVSIESESVAPATGKVQGSRAEAETGYIFEGWYVGETKVSTDFALAISVINQYAKASGAYVATTFTAKFSPDTQVEIRYTLVGTGAQISTPSETVYAKTGTAKGSSVTNIQTGYTLNGWYADADLKTLVTTEATLKEELVKQYAQVEGAYTAFEFYASVTANTDASYVVSYKEATTGKVLANAVTATGKVFNQSYTEDALAIEGYTVDASSKTVVAGYSNNEITFYYTANAQKYTVNYLTANGTALDSKTVDALFGDVVLTADHKATFTGYTFASASVETLTVGTDNTANVINLYYDAIEVEYTVNYLNKQTGNVIAETVTKVAKFAEKVTGSAEVIEITGYTFASVDPETLELGSTNNVINVYYTANAQKYTVNYLTEDGAILGSETVDALFGDVVLAADHKATFEGYTFIRASEETLTVGTNDTANVINLYYNAVEVSYTVNYLNQQTGNAIAATVTKVAKFAEKVTGSAEVIEITGYTFASVDPETLTLGLTNNEINVYYTANAQEYTVNYLAGNNTILDSKTVNALFGDVVLAADHEATIEGYTFTYADKPSLTVGVDNTANVINLHYTAIKVEYTVNFLNGENVIADAVTLEADFASKIVGAEQAISITGYTFASVNPETLTLGLTNNVINVYYTKNIHSVTVKYTEPEGEDEIEDFHGEYAFGDEFSIETPSITGYTPSVEVVSGVMKDNDMEYTVTFTPNRYTVTINYVNTSGVSLASSTVTTYTYKEVVDAITPQAIYGYTTNSGNIVVSEDGKMPAQDLVFNVVYTTTGGGGGTTDPTPDPEPETPVTPDPTPVTPDPTPVTPDPEPETPVTPDPTPVTPDPTPVTPDTTPEVTTPETPVAPVVVLDTTPVTQTPATQTVPEVTVPGDDGDYSLTPVEDTETPLANVDGDGAFCILHFLLMLAALVVLLFYTNSMKKRQRILFELEEKAKLRMLGKVVD